MMAPIKPCKTMDLPTAGRVYFGLSRNASYAAAKRGDIPTIKIGKLLRVPVEAMERLVGGVGHDAPAQPTRKSGPPPKQQPVSSDFNWEKHLYGI